MAVRCMRCRQTIDYGKSAFTLVIVANGGEVNADMLRTQNVPAEAIAMHVNGDRECGKPVSAFRKSILQALGIEEKLDLSFLDYL